MNLFILSLSQQQIAEWMFDSHIVKIILEAVQMLCAAKRLVDPEDPINEHLYKISHKNHPVSVWVRESYENYLWTLALIYRMHEEWRYRFNHNEEKFHKSYLVALTLACCVPSKDKFAKKGLTPFAQAMPTELKVEGDAIRAYQLYYMSDAKRRLAKWTKREAPDWFV
jgi:hypothetical protein